MSQNLTQQDLRNCPKADLHRHLDGSVKPDVVIALAKRLGVKLPTYDLEKFKELYQITPEMNLPELFTRFSWAIAVMRTPEGLKEVAYQQVLDLAAENILYAELRFAPGYHSIYPPPFYDPATYETEARPVMELNEVVSSVLAGLRRGSEETGSVVNLTLCIPRECHAQYDLKSAFQIAALAERFENRGVVALDLACDEFIHPPEIYTQVFRSTIGSKIRRDPHAGEMGSLKQKLENITTCISRLCAHGLGHALALHHSDRLTRLVRTLGIRIERHPLGWVGGVKIGEDGLDALLKKDVLISLCSDDPALMRQTLAQNFAAVIDHYGWEETELQQLVANSLKSAFFSSDAQKKKVEKLFVKAGLNKSLLK